MVTRHHSPDSRGCGLTLRGVQEFACQHLRHPAHSEDVEDVLGREKFCWLYDTCENSEKLRCCRRIMFECFEERDLFNGERIHPGRIEGEIIEGFGSGIALLLIVTQGGFQGFAPGKTGVESCRKQFGIAEGVTDSKTCDGVFQIAGVADQRPARPVGFAVEVGHRVAPGARARRGRVRGQWLP